jgi:hypothetical protein
MIACPEGGAGIDDQRYTIRYGQSPLPEGNESEALTDVHGADFSHPPSVGVLVIFSQALAQE